MPQFRWSYDRWHRIGPSGSYLGTAITEGDILAAWQKDPKELDIAPSGGPEALLALIHRNLKMVKEAAVVKGQFYVVTYDSDDNEKYLRYPAENFEAAKTKVQELLNDDCISDVRMYRSDEIKVKKVTTVTFEG